MRKSSVVPLAVVLFSCPWLRADLRPTNTQTLQLPSPPSDFVWDASSSHFFVSSGAAILVVDPTTASVVDTLALGGPAQKIAISGDGQTLYAAIGARGVIERYGVKDHALQAQIALGRNSSGQYVQPAAMAVLPNHPQSILVALPDPGATVVVYDGATPRSGTLAVRVTSLYVRPPDNSIFGWGNNLMYSLAVNSRGVSVGRSVAAALRSDEALSWGGNFVADWNGEVFDLNAGRISGRAGYPTSAICHYPATPDPSGQFLVVVEPGDGGTASVVEYSLTTFRMVASSALTMAQATELGVGDPTAVSKAWGNDGIAIFDSGHSYLSFFHLSDLAPVAAAAPPTPTVDASGVIHVPLPANGLAYDSGRNLVWATIPGSVAQYGNAVVSIDPATGNIVDTIGAGSEPGAVALSGDGSHLFAALGGATGVSTLDLTTKQLTQTIPAPGDTTGPARSLVAVPGTSNSVAVVWLASGVSYASQITVFDAGVPRPNSFSNFGSGSAVADSSLPFLTAIYPGDAPNSLYGADLDIQYGSGAHDVARLLVDAKGISLDKRLNALQLGETGAFGAGSGQLVYDSGNLFIGGGEVLTPDTQLLEGTFSISQSYGASGIAVPFSDRGQVAYVWEGGLSNAAGMTLFDLSTMRPLASLPLSTIGEPRILAAVRAGPTTMAVAAHGELILVPLPGLTPWPQISPVLQQVTPGVQSLAITVNAITGLPGTSKLVLALPSSAGNIGNSIAILNTDTGKIESSAFIGSEPTLLRTSVDGSAAYAYLSGELRIGRFNVASASRDLVFVPDPTGGSTQYQLVDMALGPDGGLTASYTGGWLATFDSGVLRPNVDKNTQGIGGYGGAPYQIALNPSGTIVYGNDGYWSLDDFKREAVTPDGIHYLSSTSNLIGNSGFQSAEGLLYLDNGRVIDPERSRWIGTFAVPNSGLNVYAAPDPDAGRVYFVAPSYGYQLLVFDSHTYAMLASWTIPMAGQTAAPQSLVRFGTDGLAFSSSDGHLYLVRISTIPLLAAPVASPQPTLPVTPGVTVVDLATQDIAYDASRNLIYGSAPNSEAANGDRIVAIDPGSGSITAAWPAGMNPRVLALADDQSQLYFTSGAAGLGFFSGFSPASEAIYDLDLSSGNTGMGFPVYDTSSEFSYSFVDLAAPPGQPQTVAAVASLIETAGGGEGTILGSLTVYDNGVPREKYLRLNLYTFFCGSIIFGASATQLYCPTGSVISRLAVDSQGVTEAGSIRLLPGRGPFGHMVFWNGRIYTTTGVVVDAQSGDVITRLVTQGPVATDGTLVYWLDPSTSTRTNTNVTLRAFDIDTLQAVSTKQINVTATDVTRLVSCGQGRVAFRAGHEVYIVNP